MTEQPEEKRETIGQAIDRLVSEFGSHSLGIYFLEHALLKALEADDKYVQIEEKLVSEMPRYQALRAYEKHLLDSIKEEPQHD